MAFDQHQSTFANSLFPTYKRQASTNGGNGNDGSIAQPFTPNFIVPEQDAASCMPWAQKAHDDPYELIHCVQNNIKSRNPTVSTESEGETDLHGLVSNILEEVDSQDGYSTEGNLSTFKPLWSPKARRMGLQQYFQSEPKTQHNPAFLPNHTYSESFNKVQGQPSDKYLEEFCQQFNAFDAAQQWLFTPLNGDSDSYIPQPQKPPPGLSLSSMEDSCLSQKRQSKHGYISPSQNRGNSGPVNNFPHLSEVCAPQNEMSSRSFDPYYDNYPVQGGIKPISNEQYMSQEISKLVSSFQALLAGEQESLFCREPPNTQRQTKEMPCEDSVAAQWKFTSPATSTYSAPTMQIQKEQVGDFGAAQRERNGPVRKRMFPGDSSSQDQPEFNPQNREYFEQPKPLSATFKPPNQYLNKMPMHRGNTLLPVSLRMNQCSQHHSQQNQMQNKIKLPRANCGPPGTSVFLSQSLPEFVPQHSQMQRVQLCGQEYSHGGGPAIHSQPGQSQVGTSLRSVSRKDGESVVQLENNRMHMAGFLGEGFPARAHASTHMKEQDKKQGVPQNPNFDLVGNMTSSQRFGGGNVQVSAGNTPQFVPFMFPVSDPTKRPCLPFNLPLSPLPCGSFMDRGDKISDKEFAAFNPYLGDMMGRSGDSIHPSTASASKSPRTMKNRGRSMSQLHFCLEECNEQLRCLEKERKKTEAILTKIFPGKPTAAVTNATLPKTPPNPTRVDHLIVNQIREQARVVSLMGKMERLRSIPLPAHIHSTLDRHYMAISVTQTRRKEEFVDMSKGQRQGGAPFREDRDAMLLAVALKDLCAATSKSRTALWCALQMTLPRPERLDHDAGREATSAKSSSDKFSYSYTLA